MTILPVDKIAERLAKFLAHSRNTLFAGAGIGARIDLPTWPGLLEHLAIYCESKGQEITAQLIRERTKESDLLGAATVYKSCKKLPAGEMLEKIAEPFKGTIKEATQNRLRRLAHLPFSAVVTTNYDRHFYDVLTKVRGGKAPQFLELDDTTLKHGSLRTDFFYARLHGRAEFPYTLMLDDKDYAFLATNSIYQDFLNSLLTQRPTLFLGFSFLDPAINLILSIFKQNCGPNFPSLHLAILPDTSSSDLQQTLAAVNIETVFYDSSSKHEALWKAIRQTDISLSAPTSPKRPTKAFSFSASTHSDLHRFFAYSYAKIKASGTLVEPIVKNVQDSIVLSLLEETSGRPVEKAEAISRLRAVLKIDEETASILFSDSIVRLSDTYKVRETKRFIESKNPAHEVFQKSMKTLVDGAADRHKVLFNKSVPAEDFTKTANIIETAIMVRAWDLAAQYSGGIAGQAIELDISISQIIKDLSRNLKSDPDHLTQCLVNLFKSPVASEAKVLSEFSRAAFALQLVLESPRQSLFHKYSLPQRLYFDASILMPAITNGHPYRPLYLDAIQRLAQAAKSAGAPFELLIGMQFLEEIVVHRKNSIDLVRILKLEDRKELTKYISFNGAENANVFIGAYASHNTHSKRISYKDFLYKFAPYRSIQELKGYLIKQGIKASIMDFRVKNNIDYNHVFSHLKTGYEEEHLFSLKKEKQTILIQHEAQQLTQLQLDRQNSIRSVFITADSRLQRIMQRSLEINKLLGSILSGIGLIGLVDIMVGIKVDDRAFARLIWSVPRNDVVKQLQDYLVQRALIHYDEGLAMAMSEVVETISKKAADELKAATIDLRDSSSIDDAARTTEFLDRWEEKFFKAMKAEMEKREKESDN